MGRAEAKGTAGTYSGGFTPGSTLVVSSDGEETTGVKMGPASREDQLVGAPSLTAGPSLRGIQKQRLETNFRIFSFPILILPWWLTINP